MAGSNYRYITVHWRLSRPILLCPIGLFLTLWILSPSGPSIRRSLACPVHSFARWDCTARACSSRPGSVAVAFEGHVKAEVHSVDCRVVPLPCPCSCCSALFSAAARPVLPRLLCRRLTALATVVCWCRVSRCVDCRAARRGWQLATTFPAAGVPRPLRHPQCPLATRPRCRASSRPPGRCLLVGAHPLPAWPSSASSCAGSTLPSPSAAIALAASSCCCCWCCSCCCRSERDRRPSTCSSTSAGMGTDESRRACLPSSKRCTRAIPRTRSATFSAADRRRNQAGSERS